MGVERLMRRLQLVLWHHHSLALLPSNYCLSTKSSLILSSVALFTHFSSLPWFVLLASPSHCLAFFFNKSVFPLCLLRQNLCGRVQAADVRNTGPAVCCSMDTHKDALIYGICGAMCTPCTWVAARSRGRTIKKIVRVLYVRTALKHVYVWERVICV